MTVRRLLRVFPKSFNHLSFGLLEELIVSDVGQVKERRLFGFSSEPIHRRLREQEWLALAILRPIRLIHPLLLGSGYGIPNFLLDLEKRTRFPSQLHLVEDDFDQLGRGALGSSWPTNSLSICSSPGIGSAQTKFERVILGRSFFSPIS